MQGELAATEVGAGSARLARRRAELVEAAVRAIRKVGPAASMDDMAREAGITKPILYRHFGDRAGLCRAIAERFAARLGQELEIGWGGDPGRPAAAGGGIDAYLAFAERDAAIHDFLARQTGTERSEVARTMDDFRGRLAARMAAAHRWRLVAAGRDASAAEPWAHAVIGMVTAAASWWLDTGGGGMTRGQLRDHLLDLIWNGYGALTKAPEEKRP
jgi:AcrR family transcriptional regulator